MLKLIVMTGVALFAGATVYSTAKDEDRQSEIARFNTVRQNIDYRISLLGITKGIAFVESQSLIDDGDRTPGNHAVPWMRVAILVERLTDKNEPISFRAETADGKELVGKVRIESNGHIFSSRSSGTSEVDCDSSLLRSATFPVGLPERLDASKSKVYVFTLSGKFQPAELVALRFSFGDAQGRRDLLFENVPLP